MANFELPWLIYLLSRSQTTFDLSIMRTRGAYMWADTDVFYVLRSNVLDVLSSNFFNVLRCNILDMLGSSFFNAFGRHGAVKAVYSTKASLYSPISLGLRCSLRWRLLRCVRFLIHFYRFAITGEAEAGLRLIERFVFFRCWNLQF